MQIPSQTLTSRVIPGLKSDYSIVSLPHWAWFWLDDFMIRNKVGFDTILQELGCEGNFNQTLHNLALLHQEHCLREKYNLANDNEFYGVIPLGKNKLVRREFDCTMPRIYKLFDFIACPTTLKAIWYRINSANMNSQN